MQRVIQSQTQEENPIFPLSQGSLYIFMGQMVNAFNYPQWSLISSSTQYLKKKPIFNLLCTQAPSYFITVHLNVCL